MLPPSEIRFASFLQHASKSAPVVDKKAQDQARIISDAVKNDGALRLVIGDKTKSVNAIQWVVEQLAAAHRRGDFPAGFLGEDVLLVPIPRSALRTAGGLWPSLRICEELCKAGLGAEIAPLLKRIRAVDKSAFAARDKRPTAQVHYDSTSFEPHLSTTRHRRLTLVDDRVTAGAHFAGMSARVREALRGHELRAFALGRTMSFDGFDSYFQPFEGVINLFRSGKTHCGKPHQDDLFR